ncbi:hypothetical protein ROLI_045750 (plasmid) [Roseobacter fucihabitans]|uniref:Uncharacterized protein n=1 Tax=Roseobacter fucihabitans TaxID=1537242 RepID=A0ABZ2C1M8_9RHOB|nr:ATP-binding protein [Roseobacter litoralis]MBC6967608.1 hypothetical protein [Roseobacter litoralis]
MLDHPTLDQLRTLRLDGMAEAFAEMQTQDGTADLTHAALTADLLCKSPIG